MCRGGEKKGNEGGEERVCLVVVVCVCHCVVSSWRPGFPFL